MTSTRYRLFLSCRAAAELLSRERDQPLPLLDRSALRLHLTICRSCRHYRQQLALFGRFGASLTAAALGQLPGLPLAARQRIASVLEHDAAENTGTPPA